MRIPGHSWWSLIHSYAFEMLFIFSNFIVIYWQLNIPIPEAFVDLTLAIPSHRSLGHHPSRYWWFLIVNRCFITPWLKESFEALLKVFVPLLSWRCFGFISAMRVGTLQRQETKSWFEIFQVKWKCELEPEFLKAQFKIWIRGFPWGQRGRYPPLRSFSPRGSRDLGMGTSFLLLSPITAWDLLYHHRQAFS